jgi:predicted ATPase/DNA-binding SARP family transcriptional activator
MSVEAVTFGVLGPVEARRGGDPLPLRRAKLRGLLALLLLDANRVVSADRLLDELWGGRPPATGLTALHGLVSQLRHALGDGTDEPILLTRPPGYLLHLDAEALDLQRVERRVAEGRAASASQNHEGAAEAFAGALAEWRGPPLADLQFESFAAMHVARLEELRVTIVEERIEADLACGRHAALVGELSELVAAWPLRERLRRAQVLALYRSERQAEALAAHRSAVRTLHEMGIDPSPALAALAAQVLQQDAAVAAPPSHSALPDAFASGTLTNLPVPATPFLGRRRELAGAGALLARDGVRLVTLTGPGGSGKTRLALQLAAESADRFPDGVWLAPLASLRDWRDVVPAIGAAIGGVQDVKLALARRRALLVLDNFEHLLSAAPQVAELLAACDGVDVLVTSRAPLRVAAEWTFDVLPLCREEAIALLVARTAAIRPGIDIQAAAGSVCARLDDLPLAIELAASRLRVMPVDAFLQRLERALPMLTSGARDAPERQQTLRATIAWSVGLLDPDAQRLFARLSVFRGGFTLDAAESVCAADVEQLEALVAQSLVRPGASRYEMLETVRDYAGELLAGSGEEEAVAGRHVAWYARLAAASFDVATKGLGEAGEIASCLAELRAERDNLGAAIDEALRRDDAASAACIAATASAVWESSRMVESGLETLERVLEATGAFYPQPFVTLALVAVKFAMWRGDERAVNRLLTRFLEDVPEESPWAAFMRAELDFANGDVERASKGYELLADVEATRPDDPERFYRKAHGHLRAIGLALRSDDVARAVMLGERAWTLSDYLSTYGRADVARALGLALTRAGEGERARQLVLPLADELLPHRSVHWAFVWLLALTWEQDEPARTATLLASMQALQEAAGIASEPFEQTLEGGISSVQSRLAARIGREAFDEAWRAGATLSMAEAVELAGRPPRPRLARQLVG